MNNHRANSLTLLMVSEMLSDFAKSGRPSEEFEQFAMEQMDDIAALERYARGAEALYYPALKQFGENNNLPQIGLENRFLDWMLTELKMVTTEEVYQSITSKLLT